MKLKLPTVAVSIVALTGGLLAPTAAVAAPPAAQKIEVSSTLSAPVSAAPAPVPANLKVTFYWSLKRPEKAARAAHRAITNPRSPRYRQYLTLPQLRRDFGAPAKARSAIKKFVRSRGLQARIDKSGTLVYITGTPAQFQSGLGTELIWLPFDYEGFDMVATANYPKGPKLPERIQRLIKEQVWLYQYQSSLNASSAQGAQQRLRKLEKAARTRSTAAIPTNQGRLVGVCKKFRESKTIDRTMSIQQAVVAYGAKHLQLRHKGKGKQRYNGKQPLIGVLALGSGFDNSYLAAAARCAGARANAQRIATDGLIGPLPSGLEGNLDVQMASLATHGAPKIPVFEAGPLGTSMFTAVYAVVSSKQRPTVLTSSYGTCEPNLNKQFMRISEGALMRLGLLGTGVFVATGDTGSTSCVSNQDFQGPHDLAVWYPASSPYVTAVGGSRLVLNPNNTIAREVTWNDSAFGLRLAGTGGKSRIFSRPDWQTKGLNGAAKRRTVPDVVAHASAFPGFPLVLEQPGEFAEPVAGTSAATPFTASMFALLNAREINRGRAPLGFINPWTYQNSSGLARPAPRGDRRGVRVTRDIVRGNNAVYNPRCCEAGPGYDMATGLGSFRYPAVLRQLDRR